jgi:cytochrome c-type biogenesis protein CcmH/NrfF
MRSSHLLTVLALASCAFAADPAALERGRQAEQKACTPCHSLRLVDSQRLSAAAWKKEIAKMVGWGAVVQDEQVMLDYLAAEYGDTKPVPEPARSQGGQGSARSDTNPK